MYNFQDCWILFIMSVEGAKNASFPQLHRLWLHLWNNSINTISTITAVKHLS